jgi:hypothetical protein
MGNWDWLSGIGAEDEQNANHGFAAQIARSTAKGSGFYQTDATGDGATALQDTAANVAKQKAVANWAQANASASQLSGIANQATQMGLNGGQQGAAAVHAAQAAIANSGGGLGGLKAVGQAGAQDALGASKIAQSESSNFLSQASTEKNAVSSAKLQQLVVNAALAHANRQNALAANNVGLGVTNLQNSTATQLNTAAMQTNRKSDALQIAESNAESANALQYATALTSGLASGAGALSSAIGSTSDGTSAVSDFQNNLGSTTLSTDPSLGLTNTPDYSTASLTDPTADGLNYTSSTAAAPTQLTLDQSLFSTPSNIFGVY